MRTIIIGAGGELGSTLVSTMLSNGHKVAALDLCFTEIRTTNQVISIPVDIRKSASIEQAINQAHNWLGGFDIFIHVAGVISRTSIQETSDNQLETIIDVNLTGAIRAIKRIAKVMIDQRTGSILHIGSVHSLVGVADRAAYAASKGGVTAFIRSAAAELGPNGVTINTLAPGPMGNGMGNASQARQKMINATPLNRVAEINEIIETALFMTSPEASFITGQTLAVDGGFSVTRMMQANDGHAA